jgi:hypothetical protein
MKTPGRLRLQQRHLGGLRSLSRHYSSAAGREDWFDRQHRRSREALAAAVARSLSLSDSQYGVRRVSQAHVFEFCIPIRA